MNLSWQLRPSPSAYLLFSGVKDRAAVLRAAIVALRKRRGGVVPGPEGIEELGEKAWHFGVVHYAGHLTEGAERHG